MAAREPVDFRRRMRVRRAGGVLAGLLAAGVGSAAEGPRPVEFNRDVRPILSENCFQCHGFDEKAREARLRLDVRAVATAPAKSGAIAIVPGHPEGSELLLRVTDAEDRMPPAETGKRLKPAEIETLRRWIAAGAEYEPHWSLVPPRSVPVPAVRRADWPRHELDRFVLARLEEEGLSPAAEADRTTWLRRVSFDLTGLPPSLEELDAFLADARPDAAERAVDRLLASPHYGERMAVDWLDAARYADSNGFFRDNTRQAWPWRDWVIGAFNRNLPYDQFTIEQLAGDLLPEPTEAQRIATGFNRNHMVTGETGIIDEEYRVEYVADRLETTAAVWLGLTVGCARCHDHKFDPISQRDYYRLFAFFNSGVEKGLVSPDDPPPVMDVASAAERAGLERLRRERTAAEQAFARVVAPLEPAVRAWETQGAAELAAPAEALLADLRFEADAGAELAGVRTRGAEKGAVYYEPGIVGKAAVFDGMQHLELPADVPLDADRAWTVGLWVKASSSLGCLVSKIEPSGDRRGVELIWSKGQLQVNLVDRWVVSAIEVVTRSAAKRADWNHVVVSYDGAGRAAGLRIFIDGAEAPVTVTRDQLQGPIGNREPVRIGRRDSGLGFYGQLDEFRLMGRAVTAEEIRTWYWSERLRGILAADPARRDARQKKLVLDCYVERQGDAAARTAHRRSEAARDEEEAFRSRLPKTLVMQEAAAPRTTQVLARGQYDAPGEEVAPGVPEVLPPLPPDAPRNRLGLARWLVAPGHPLTARVAVNRLWAQCFGEGLVATVHDFGSQGEGPSHPELLDWLARRFVESGWDVKAMLRLLVTSATYRQTSVPAPELLQRDPANRLLARGPRFRLPAEMIRDQALAVAGLLVDRPGGPPVKPYQPPGLWEAVSYNGELTYQADTGDGLWRRSVYTHWKRTAPPPGLQIFDGPTRETCVLRRPRTNTPMQALLLLNDEQFVEAARVLAATAWSGADPTDAGRLRAMFRRATSRWPEPEELAALAGLHARQRARFAADPPAAQRLIAVGASGQGRDHDPVTLAALTVAAQVILNLDEVVTRR